MPELTLDLLASRLPLSSIERTCHVLASIGKPAVLLRYLEHDPLWGFRLLAEQRLESEWRDGLVAIARSLPAADGIDSLLDGGVPAVDSTGRVLALETTLAGALAGKPDRPIDSLLPLAPAAHRSWYELLGKVLNTQRSLDMADGGWLWRDELLGEFKSEPRRFPWDLRVVIAREEGNKLVASRAPLLAKGAPVGRDGRYRARLDLALPPGAKETQIAVTRELAHGAEQVYRRFSIAPDQPAFTLAATFSPKEPDPKFTSTHGELRELPSGPIPSESEELATVEYKSEPVDVAFLLDGSMSAAEFSAARDFALDLANDLAFTDPNMRLAYVLYAEYMEKRGSTQRRRWEYETREHGFAPHAEFARALELEAPANVTDDDPCDALELGLSKLADLKWEAGRRFVILIGNSPPHPRNDERRKYRLLDRESEQHSNLAWKQLLGSLEARKKTRLVSVWVEPQKQMAGYTRGWRKYASDVWSRAGRDLSLQSADRKSSEEVAEFIRCNRPGTATVRRVIDYPVANPLTRTTVASS